jgi:hypothetical protein
MTADSWTSVRTPASRTLDLQALPRPLSAASASLQPDHLLPTVADPVDGLRLSDRGREIPRFGQWGRTLDSDLASRLLWRDA